MTQDQLAVTGERPLNIGMVCPYSFDEPGGVQIHAIELCAELQRRGHRVSLIGPGEQREGLPEFLECGGPSIPIRYNGSVARLSFGPRARRHLRRWIARHDFDVVHIHEPNSPSYSMLTLAVAEGPMVATYHASASGSKILKLALPALRPFLEKIHAGIAVSEEARRWQVEMLAGDPVLIPNGVDTGAYREAEVLPELDPDRPRLMFLGRFDEPRKGLQVVLGAMPSILLQHPNVELLVVGAGSVEALGKRLDGMGLSWVHGRQPSEATVRVLGKVSDEVKARALASSDIYVAPNTGGESFGIVLVEAMAAGAAVVASDIPAFKAVGDQGRAACLFANHDAANLALKINRLLSEPAEIRELAARGQDRSRMYDWNTVASSVEQVYQTATLKGRKVTCS